MIFQYTRVFSETDSKRHYRWECISHDYEYVFVFLTPNGNRYPEVIDNTTRNTLDHEQINSTYFRNFVNRIHDKPLEMYNKIILDYPMVPHIFVNESRKNNQVFFKHALRRGLEMSNLCTIIKDCHFCVMEIEIKLLQYDEELKSKQQMSAFWNEVTNVLGKFESTSFLTNCLQQLNVSDKKESERPIPIRSLDESPNTKRAKRPLPSDMSSTGVKRQKHNDNVNLCTVIDMET